MKAYRCGDCGDLPVWSIERRGDAVVSWSCCLHLHEVCRELQRPHERTTLVVRVAVLPTDQSGVAS